MNKVKIVSERVGYSNSVLIVNGKNSILIDTGVRGHIPFFKKFFQNHKLEPTDIKLIILTHTHYDHTGNLRKLKELTGAKVLVHRKEFEGLKNGFIRIPEGVSFKTKFIANLGRMVLPKYASPKSFVADLVNDNEFNLTNFGVNAKVISTPGHTAGSQSVLMGDTLISGDTFINLKSGIIFPHFADQPKILLQTWKHLFDLGIQKIYPGHGPILSVEAAMTEYKKWEKRLNP